MNTMLLSENEYCDEIESWRYGLIPFGLEDFIVPTILILDNNDEQRNYFKAFLQQEDYAVLTAKTTKAAMDLLESRHVDLVVCDVAMPNISGADYMFYLRQNSLFMSLPIIVLTGSDEDLEFAAITSGADMFCHKRNAKEILVPQIRFLLNQDF